MPIKPDPPAPAEAPGAAPTASSKTAAPAKPPKRVTLVLSTLPNAEAAADLARVLVEERLVACVNLVPQIRSIYRWEGAVQDETETLAIMKTTEKRSRKLVKRVAELHPYDTPEVLVVAVRDGHPAYLAWVGDSVKKPR